MGKKIMSNVTEPLHKTLLLIEYAVYWKAFLGEYNPNCMIWDLKNCLLHFEVSVDIGRQVCLVKQEVVSHDVECQAASPVGSRVI